LSEWPSPDGKTTPKFEVGGTIGTNFWVTSPSAEKIGSQKNKNKSGEEKGKEINSRRQSGEGAWVQTKDWKKESENVIVGWRSPGQPLTRPTNKKKTRQFASMTATGRPARTCLKHHPFPSAMPIGGE